MDKYEYCFGEVIALTTSTMRVSIDISIKTLDELGNEGWELVSINEGKGGYFKTDIAIFKRQKQN